MLDWLKARMRERSTLMGLVAITLAISLLVIPAVMPADAAALASENVKWLIGALFASGIGAVLWNEKPR